MEREDLAEAQEAHAAAQERLCEVRRLEGRIVQATASLDDLSRRNGFAAQVESAFGPRRLS